VRDLLAHVLPLLLGLSMTIQAQAVPLLEIAVEGPGPFTMDDAERITPVVRRALRRRFPAGFQRAQVSLRNQRRGGPTHLVVELEAPQDLPTLKRLQITIALRRWRQFLDGESSRRLGLQLERFRLVLRREILEEILGDGHLHLERILPLARFAPPEEAASGRKAFLQAAQDAGFPPAGDELLRNTARNSHWLVSGNLGPPLGRWIGGILHPQVDSGGFLGIRVLAMASRRRSLTSREALALERRFEQATTKLWKKLEETLQAEAYLVSCEVENRGDLVLRGVGYTSFDRERDILSREDRRRSWRPTLLVNPGR
jgi:hypothetical protein